MNNRKLLTALMLAMACAGGSMAADAGKGAAGPIRGACKNDVVELCKGVKPGGGRMAACLKEHKEKVSDACKSAIKEERDRRKGAKSGGAAEDQNDE